MQKLLKGFILFLSLSIFFVITLYVNAAGGTATISIGGPSTANVGSNIKLLVSLSSITGVSDGIGSTDCILEFDPTYLAYVSSTSKSVVSLTVNALSNKLNASGFAPSNGAPGSNVDIWEIEFKTLTTGSTSVKLNGIVVGDGNMSIVSVTPTSVTKNITIGESTPSASTNADLKALSVSGYTISPTFAKNTTSYTLTVPNSVSSVTVNATADDSKATLSGTGSKSLNVGSNTASITVTAEDGTTKKTYTISITREAAGSNPASSNNNLSALEVEGYTISPAFSSGTTTYNLTVPNNAEEIIIKATKADSTASVTGTGTKVVNTGNNQYSIIVTAADGSKKTYTINVTRETTSANSDNKSSDATLKNLSITGYPLSPSFNKNTNNYTITVPSSVKDLAINADPTDPNAKITIVGNTNMSSGTNNVVVKVTAEDGTDKYYVVTVKRENDTSTATKNTNNYLSTLEVKNYPISYNKNTNSYSITVPYEVDKLDITALAENSKSVVSVKGNSNFKVGEVNTVEVSVTAEDGSLRIYTLNVYRSPIASKNKLSELDVDNGDLSPQFDPDVEEYDLKVKNSVEDLDIFFKTQDPNAKVEVIGNKDLSVGQNVVKVKVTDANGFTRTYLINVDRAEPFKIMGMNPWVFGSLAGTLLGLLLLIIFLAKKRDKEEVIEEKPAPAPLPEKQILDTQPTINFSPVINIGSQNDSEISGDNANKQYYNNVANEREKIKEPDVLVPEYKELEFKELEFKESDNNTDIDELMTALRNEDTDKLDMFRKQIEADELKDELRGKDSERNDDIFDDEVTVREVIKAIDKYEKTGDARTLELLIKQYQANKLREKSEQHKPKSRMSRIYSED